MDATYATGFEIGRRVDAIGADVVIAPVADVNTDPRNPVIGVRAFGSRTELVSRHVAAAVRGLQSTGVAACAKHYPGHGDTHTDSHHDLPRLTLGQDELDRVHLPPFTAAVNDGVLSIMTAHIAAPQWGDAPAAGADLLCIGNPTNPGAEMLTDQDERDYREARDAIVAAIRSGKLPRERVEEAARRALLRPHADQTDPKEEPT